MYIPWIRRRQVSEHYRKQSLYQVEHMRGEAAVRCFVGALIDLWLWWVRHDYPNSVQEMTETFDSLMNNATWPPACGDRE